MFNNRESLGLYLDKDWLAIVKVAKDAAGSIKILERKVTAMPAGIFSRGVVSDPKNLAELIKQVYPVPRDRPPKVFVAVSCRGIVRRTLAFALASRDETAAAAKAEIDKYAMLGAATSLFGYCRLDKERIVLAALKKKCGSSILEACDKAGLELVSLEIVPFCFWRALSAGDSRTLSEKTLLVVTTGAERLDIDILKGGVPEFSHSAEDISPEAFLHEIKMVCAYWGQQSAGQLDAVLMFSHHKALRELSREVSETAAVPLIEARHPVLDYQPDGSNCPATAAFGAALRKFDAPAAIAIDLIPEEKIKRDTLKRDLIIAFSAVVVTIFAWFFLSLAADALINSYKDKIAQLHKKYGLADDVVSSAQKMNKRKTILSSGIQSKEAFLKKIELTSWTNILDDLARFIPPEVYLNEVSIEGGDRLSIKGAGYSEAAVYKYVNILRYSDYLVEPRLTLIENQGGATPMVVFEITCSLA